VTTGTAKRGRKQRDNANELLIAMVYVVMSETWGDICAVIPYVIPRFWRNIFSEFYHPEDEHCSYFRNFAYLATKVHCVIP
jgi:hypothetical protein